ncbi:MAG: HAD family hydrolase, partial [Bryobacteraceae bacterium]
ALKALAPAVELVIFDLDGTLIDSQRDLADSVNAARGHLGLPPIDNERVYSYVGDGAPTLIRRALGPEAPESQVLEALEYFLSYYRDHMLDHTHLYPGVRETLARLRQDHVRMAVLTNKPVRFSQALVEGLGLGGHFARVYGGNSFDRKKPDPVGVEKLREELGVAREGVLMVGDSGVDVRPARNAGIRACGVTWGFQPETFASDPPDVTIDRMEQLADLILS